MRILRGDQEVDIYFLYMYILLYIYIYKFNHWKKYQDNYNYKILLKLKRVFIYFNNIIYWFNLNKRLMNHYWNNS